MKTNKTYSKKKSEENREEIPNPSFTPKEADAEEEPGDLPGDLEVKGVFGQEIGTSEKFRKKATGENSENL